MNKSKKLFNSEDFDKKKPLFEPEDFDKSVKENQKDEKEQVPVSGNDPYSPHPVEKSSKAKIIGGIVAAAFIIAGGIFFANNDKANDSGSNKPATETVAQEGEKHDAGSNDSTTELNGKTEAMASAEEEKPSTNEDTPKSYAADESHVTTSTEKSSTSPSENSDNNVDGDVETNARRVIRGDFGNGQERRDKLGSSYSEIQGKVNEMYRQGLVH